MMNILKGDSKQLNKKAILKSRLYESKLNQPDCFKFWYYMNGKLNGTLNVILKQANIIESLNELLWSRDVSLGYIGDRWRYAFVNIQSSNDFEILIEALSSDLLNLYVLFFLNLHNHQLLVLSLNN